MKYSCSRNRASAAGPMSRRKPIEEIVAEALREKLSQTKETKTCTYENNVRVERESVRNVRPSWVPSLVARFDVPLWLVRCALHGQRGKNIVGSPVDAWSKTDKIYY